MMMPSTRRLLIFSLIFLMMALGGLSAAGCSLRMNESTGLLDTPPVSALAAERVSMLSDEPSVTRGLDRSHWEPCESLSRRAKSNITRRMCAKRGWRLRRRAERAGIPR